MILPRKAGDWDFARGLYESTTHHVDDIAKAIGVSPTMLISRASREGWTRDPTGKTVQHLTNLALAEKEKHRIKVAEIERVNVQMQSEVLVKHRRDIAQARTVCTKLFTELATNGPEDLGDQVNILKKLADSMKTLILLERQAYGIQTALEDPEKPPEVTTPDRSSTDKVMEKFASILSGIEASLPTAKDMGTVIEIGPNS